MILRTYVTAAVMIPIWNSPASTNSVPTTIVAIYATCRIVLKPVAGRDVHLPEISVAQRGVHTVEFRLFKALVGKGTDQPHGIDIFLYGQIHVRIARADAA